MANRFDMSDEHGTSTTWVLSHRDSQITIIDVTSPMFPTLVRRDRDSQITVIDATSPLFQPPWEQNVSIKVHDPDNSSTEGSDGEPEPFTPLFEMCTRQTNGLGSFLGYDTQSRVNDAHYLDETQKAIVSRTTKAPNNISLERDANHRQTYASSAVRSSPSLAVSSSPGTTSPEFRSQPSPPPQSSTSKAQHKLAQTSPELRALPSPPLSLKAESIDSNNASQYPTMKRSTSTSRHGKSAVTSMRSTMSSRSDRGKTQRRNEGSDHQSQKKSGVVKRWKSALKDIITTEPVDETHLVRIQSGHWGDEW